MKDSFVKRFLLTCNPWFLASTLFLLLGIYLVYVDPKLAGKDQTQMYISFSSLQLYEVLCLGVIFLFRRIKLFYDSVFLVVIISLLLFVPFITFNQALQYEDSALELLGYTALILAALKLLVLKVGFKKLNFPWVFMFAAFLMLIMNFALPFIMRGLNLEEDTAGRDFIYEVFSVAIPLLGFIGYLAMHHIKGGKEVYKSKWLPITLFQCLFSVTLVNLMSVMFVYDIEYKSMYYAVTLLVSGFLTLHPVIGLNSVLKRVILASCLFVALTMLGTDYKNLLALVMAIILLFSISLSDKWMGLISFSFLALLALENVPFVRMTYAQMCLIVLLIALTMHALQEESWSTLIIPGLLMIMLLVTYKVSHTSLLIFSSLSYCLLLVSLWEGSVFKREVGFIISLALLWSFVGVITHMQTGWKETFFIGLSVMAIQLLRRYVFKIQQPMAMILMSLVITLLWPFEQLIELLEEQSFSIIIIILSFVIFIAGTCVTYSKRVRTIDPQKE
ncbi:MAG: hypothetical protein NE327_10920 [Lentisphaeraceae bacterium]|nr:hypothetical protein [Lentisphaeraceae bacterium]